jgi:pimeloyl-ACP methyl ester carboxylesterase
LTKTVFLPGAGGRRAYWQPVADLLSPDLDSLTLGWPGFGDEPPRPDIHALSALGDFVLDRVDGDMVVVAQSMGGVVALQLALRAPERVRGLVLCATSGGIDFGAVEREDWRPEYLREMPETTPRWFVDDRTDLTAEIRRIEVPVLVISGAEDTIVPPAAGQVLARLLPNARLVVVASARHDIAVTHASEVASLLTTFLESLPAVLPQTVSE